MFVSEPLTTFPGYAKRGFCQPPVVSWPLTVQHRDKAPSLTATNPCRRPAVCPTGYYCSVEGHGWTTCPSKWSTLPGKMYLVARNACGMPLNNHFKYCTGSMMPGSEFEILYTFDGCFPTTVCVESWIGKNLGCFVVLRTLLYSAQGSWRLPCAVLCFSRVQARGISGTC